MKPPCTERYAWWCERTAVNHRLLLDSSRHHKFVYVGRRCFWIIEEPEAYIYPLLQKRVMEFIAFFANMQYSGVLITGHSLYIFTVANNQYYAGELAENGQAKQIYNILIENPKSRLYN